MKIFLGILFILVSIEVAAQLKPHTIWSSKDKDAALNGNWVFASSVTYDGATVGGVAGADSKCQSLATAAGLPGTWQAIIGSSTVTAVNRVTGITGPIYNMQGTTIATTWANFWSGSINYPVRFSEYGTFLTSGVAWTGCPGATCSSPSANHCSDWSSTTGNGAGGNITYTQAWFLATNTLGCASQGRLVCISSTINIVPKNTKPKKYHTLFMTSTTYNGNLGGVSGANSLCQARAAAASLAGTYVALISTTSSTVGNLVPILGGVKLRNGIAIADSATDLYDNWINRSINIDEFGNTIGSIDPWTYSTGGGGKYGALLTESCNDWTDGTSSFNGRASSAVSTGSISQGWIYGSNLATCDSLRRLLCISAAAN